MKFKRKKGFEAIVAMDENRGIGINNRLPWVVPMDLRWFKKKTINKTVIVGRLTAESVSWKPFSKRDNYVLTKQESSEIRDGWLKYSDDLKQELISRGSFILGGMHIYKLFWDDIETFWVTEIAHKFTVDTVFDLDFSDTEWAKEFVSEHGKTNQSDHPIKIYKYSRL